MNGLMMTGKHSSSFCPPLFIHPARAKSRKKRERNSTYNNNEKLQWCSNLPEEKTDKYSNEKVCVKLANSPPVFRQFRLSECPARSTEGRPSYSSPSFLRDIRV